MLTGLLMTAGLPPDRYDPVMSLATSLALRLRSFDRLPVSVVDLERDHKTGDAHR